MPLYHTAAVDDAEQLRQHTDQLPSFGRFESALVPTNRRLAVGQKRWAIKRPLPARGGDFVLKKIGAIHIIAKGMVDQGLLCEI